MIEYIYGELSELSPTLAVIEAGGVGYAINIALTTFTQLTGKERTATAAGQPCRLYCTEIIREDTHELYGFPTKGERALFEMMMTVSGIGGNTARLIMSAYSAADIRQIIATGNVKALSSIKGFGPKTAQRLIVDLKDKVLKVDLGVEAATNLFDEPVAADSEVKTEAVSALTMLGFPAAASSKVVDKLLVQNPQATVEAVIRQALKLL
ncbi:MAG: Holliday junction branch migration protein RuvA [Paludibacteraceae bacterium]|nr:Holliday junction branch migration protein RuvA [Paludibacteraceae bacterium]